METDEHGDKFLRHEIAGQQELHYGAHRLTVSNIAVLTPMPRSSDDNQHFHNGVNFNGNRNSSDE